MIIQNGTIEIKVKRGGGIDSDTGHPKEATAKWGRPIPCQFVPVAHDKRATYDGEPYTLESYMVLVEEQPSCVTGEQIRLKDNGGNTVGEYSVRAIEYLEAVCEYKITI